MTCAMPVSAHLERHRRCLERRFRERATETPDRRDGILDPPLIDRGRIETLPFERRDNEE